MPLLTWRQLKESKVPKTLGYCPDDPRLKALYNAGEQRMLNHGRFLGTVAWVQFCVDSLGCVVLPRNVAAVERWAVGGVSAHMENWYWSFIRYVGRIPTCRNCNNCGTEGGCGCGALYAIQSGFAPTQVRMQTVPGPKYVKLYPQNASDVGKRVLIQGYDASQQWVRRSYDGVWIDGEYVTLALPWAVSTSQYTAITGAQKDLTNMPVSLYSYDPVTGIEVKLAEWDSDEESPNYQVFQMPKSACNRRCGTSGSTVTVDALVKFAHIDIRLDTDWLLIGNINAIEHCLRAELHYEANRDTEGDKEMIRCINELNHELRTGTGDRTEVYVDVGTIRPNIRTFAGFR